MKHLELLAPAKNLQQGKSAVNYGADAVYVGAPMFGARASVGVSVKDIAELVRFSHLYNAKVYAALNTILFDNELEKAREIIHQLYNVGVDALIIQDMGILEMDLPPIPLHASTQANNRDLEHIRFLEKVGFERVILARELSLEDIQKIHVATRHASSLLELEAFVHGALCVCYSGQCYMSFEATKRSANRGECAQFCRLPYTLKNENGKIIFGNKHLLSPKDLNLSNRLNELIDAGITSFKIEGRLKDEAYIKNVVSYYRKALDEILLQRLDCQKPSFGTTKISFVPNLEKSFNRGFTEYFLSDRPASLCSMDTPKSKGEYLGKISKIERQYFEIDNKTVQFQNGDGLCFLNNDGVFTGLNINKVVSTSSTTKIFPNQFNGLAIDTIIYRNFDAAFEKQVKNDAAIRQMNIEISIRETAEHLELSGILENGLQHFKTIPKSNEQANDLQKNFETIRKQLEKSGGTIFCLSLKSSENSEVSGYYPISVLNQLRRDFLDELIVLIEDSYPKSIRKTPVEYPEYPVKSLTYKHNVSNQSAKQFYKKCGVQNIEPAFELNPKPNADLMVTKYCLLHELGKCCKPSPSADFTLITSNNEYSLNFDCENCEMRIRKLYKPR
ncbi:MAG: U32 family peptidase [Bacteroidales bacterium]|jgi:putative protease|nr:U32 family peptidase [Bacteroidales bacterium]